MKSFAEKGVDPITIAQGDLNVLLGSKFAMDGIYQRNAVFFARMSERKRRVVSFATIVLVIAL